MKRTRTSPDKGQRKLSCFFKRGPVRDGAVLKDVGNLRAADVRTSKDGPARESVMDGNDFGREESEVVHPEPPDGGDSADGSVALPVTKVVPSDRSAADIFADDDDFSFFDGIGLTDSDKENCNLRLDVMQRCQVESVEKMGHNELVVKLSSLKDYSSAVCIIQSPWSCCPISVGDVVSVRAATQRDGQWVVDGSGLLVLHSDELVTGTAVVGSLFCKRKSVLGATLKESGSSPVMVVGSLVHELLQEVLKRNLRSLDDIDGLFRRTVASKDFVYRLYAEGVEFDATVAELSQFVPQIHKFVVKYLANGGSRNKEFRSKDDGWVGEISSVEDIEECVWAPPLGVKGKIDATVKVKTNGISKVMPLELKTGRASFSAEHRGQVILYCMLLSHLGHNVDSGLLLYLREGVMKEVRAGDAEKRDLVALRNELSHWLAESRRPNVGGAPRLPPPIDHHSACAKCPHLTVCSSALVLEGSLESLRGGNPLKRLAVEATAHLSGDHLRYVFDLMSVVMAERTQGSSPLWAESHHVREAKGAGVANLQAEKVTPRGTRFEHDFVKIDGSLVREDALKEDQYVVVNTDTRYAIASGFVSCLRPTGLSVLLDKNIMDTPGPFHVDRMETSAQSTIPLGNLALLLDDSRKAASLRESIIDLKVPKFATKLSSKIVKVGGNVFKRLNRDQERAILQVLSAERYILIKGMPGTGKTSTIVALIELLTSLGRTVVVTSYTHSALDNILLGLVGRVDFLRLGTSGRVHPDILPHAEETLLRSTDGTTDDLRKLYEKKPVVGVTCHGSWHFVFDKRSFDVCIVDEATQVHQPIVLKPLFAASKFVLVGDPEQLSPLVQSKLARENGLGVSLFERLDRPAVTTRLTLQYRMNAEVLRLANGITYGGQLKCADRRVENATLAYDNSEAANGWPDWLKLCLSRELDRSVVVLDVKRSTPDVNAPATAGHVNVDEADLVLKILRALKEVGVRAEDVGVMSPYRAQADMLERRAAEIDPRFEVKTVDRYQGRDKLVMLYSCTRHSPPAANDIMNDNSRLTVAVTRAKVKMIILGDVGLLRLYPTYSKLFQLIPESNFYKIS